MIGSPLATRLFVAASVVAIALAACAPSGTSKASTAAASGTACQKAPAPAPNLEGWQPPASAPPIYPTIIAAPGELTCGRNRLLFTFTDPSNNVLSKPDRSAKVALYDLGRDPTKPVATADGTFVWAIQDERGIYVATVDIPEAGTYGFEFTTSVAGGPSQTIRATSDIEATTSLVQVGQHAPSTKTPTAADAGGDLSHISTDAKPDPAFYQASEDQALAAHKPFVLIFATPKFCQSFQCGPTLDRIKPFVTKYPNVTFIHVEPYELQLESGELQPVITNKALTPTATTNAWGLSSEPWVFVVDSQGVVRGSFGLIFSDGELTAALDTLK